MFRGKQKSHTIRYSTVNTKQKFSRMRVKKYAKWNTQKAQTKGKPCTGNGGESDRVHGDKGGIG